MTKCSLCYMEIDKWKPSRTYPMLELQFCCYCIKDNVLAVKRMVNEHMKLQETEA